jgi:hypothetical protein
MNSITNISLRGMILVATGEYGLDIFWLCCTVLIDYSPTQESSWYFEISAACAIILLFQKNCIALFIYIAVKNCSIAKQWSRTIIGNFIKIILLLLFFVLSPLACFPSKLIGNYGSLYTVGRTSWLGYQSYRKSVTYTGQHTCRRNAGRHPCLEWDLNSWS